VMPITMCVFFFQAEDGIRDRNVTGVQTCALPICRDERVEWFLASIYCTCPVKGDRCTGMFYTLASCNPNGCGMPNAMRKHIGKRSEERRVGKESRTRTQRAREKEKAGEAMRDC